ncbi:MAG: hypothetical protein ACI9N1_000728 [Flavobacteriales bacterium]|jgi:hypothetical protein
MITQSAILYHSLFDFIISTRAHIKSGMLSKFPSPGNINGSNMAAKMEKIPT